MLWYSRLRSSGRVLRREVRRRGFVLTSSQRDCARVATGSGVRGSTPLRAVAITRPCPREAERAAAHHRGSLLAVALEDFAAARPDALDRRSLSTKGSPILFARGGPQRWTCRHPSPPKTIGGETRTNCARRLTAGARTAKAPDCVTPLAESRCRDDVLLSLVLVIGGLVLLSTQAKEVPTRTIETDVSQGAQ